MSLENGVMFGEIHSYNDWGLILTNATIGIPAPKTEIIDLPGADGSIDLTEALTGEIAYENRQLSFEFSTTQRFSGIAWENLLSQIAADIHGKRLYIIIDDDKQYRYYGRCAIDAFSTNRYYSKITIVCDCDPYKYDVNSPGHPWMWDPFSFVDGIIQNEQIEVNGSATVSYLNRAKRVTPTFICSADMTLTFKNAEYSLKTGENIIYSLTFAPGEEVELTFTGNGTVSVIYEAGIL